MTLQHPVRPRSRPVRGEPTWDVAQLYPPQGSWTVEQYLNLDTNHLVEFSDGVLEFLPMPTEFHQCLMLFFYDVLRRFVLRRHLGVVLLAPMRVRVGAKKFREPDVLFMREAHGAKRYDQYWDGADLVMEVVSQDDPNRDFEDKPRDYAQAGISEYWIIDPETRRVHVLTLKGKRYVEAGTYSVGQRASSVELEGFSIDITKLFKSADATRKSGGTKRNPPS